MTILLTGFPSTLAHHLVALLLRDPAATIIALIAPREIARANAAARALAPPVPGTPPRLRCQPYDPATPDLGLGSVLTSLAAETTHLFHLTGPGTPCEAVPPTGTAAILAFAARCPDLSRFVYLSTAFVSGNHAGPFAEGDFDLGQDFKNNWEKRAFAAERIVRAATPDLPITVARPTFVVGDARTGAIDRFAGAYAALRFLDRFDLAGLPPPMIGRGRAQAQIIPLDYVAAALAQLATHPDAVGRTVHLADPDAPTVWEAIRTCAELLLGRAPAWGLAPPIVARALRARPFRRLGVPPTIVPYFDHPVTYGTARAHALLAPAGIVPPSFHDYAPALVAFYAAHGDDPAHDPLLA